MVANVHFVGMKTPKFLILTMFSETEQRTGEYNHESIVKLLGGMLIGLDSEFFVETATGKNIYAESVRT
jgi:hypothetical protein